MWIERAGSFGGELRNEWGCGGEDESILGLYAQQGREIDQEENEGTTCHVPSG